MKILSIIVPSYNMEAYLPQCLGSLVILDNSLMQQLEIIVVNDGSKDHTSDIAHKFENEFPASIRVIDKSNGHYGSCVNAALLAATGKYIKVLDADDSFDTDALAEYLKYLVTLDCDPDMIITDFCRVNEQGVETGRVVHGFCRDSAFDVGKLLLHDNVIVMHSITYRTALLREIGYRQTEGMVYTDGEWCFTPIMFVDKIMYCPVVLYKYLIGREGQSVATYGKNIAMQVHLLKYMVDVFCSYQGKLSGDCRQYLAKNIKHIAAITYSTYFFKCPIRTINDGLASVDLYLKNHVPDVYKDMDGLSILSNTRFKIYYVRRWRRNGHLSLVGLWAMQMYMRHVSKFISFIK